MMPSGGGGGCNSTCGCAVPCPGGASCRCASGRSGDEQSSSDHKKCSCGQHCGCNPCTCSGISNITGTGKAHCKCGPGCTCPTCTA